jgi:serine/threonine protein kinase
MEGERSDVFEVTDPLIAEQEVVRYGGRYELLSLVGAGAYGAVYRALDNELDDIVAVKVLRREHIDQPGTLARFRREVRLARRVAHPNIARTYDIGSHSGERFLTMEYIDGPPLTRLSPFSAALPDLLPLRLVIDVMVQLCAGLGALHGAGIVHRGRKPRPPRRDFAPPGKSRGKSPPAVLAIMSDFVPRSRVFVAAVVWRFRMCERL